MTHPNQELSDLSHELGNVLLPLMMGLELLREPMTDAARMTILDGLKESTLRAESITHRLAQLANPDSDTAEAAIPAAPPPPLSDIPHARGETVLVVDDEPAILDMIRQILTSHGYAVRTASSGEEACAVFREHHATLSAVIVDVVMPVMDGHAVIRNLVEADPAVRIIAISGKSGDLFGPDMLNTNVRGFLHKPFTAYTLLKTLDILVH